MYLPENKHVESYDRIPMSLLLIKCILKSRFNKKVLKELQNSQLQFIYLGNTTNCS